jgi:hypothetical protein
MSVTSKVIIVGGIESKSGISQKDGKDKPWTRYSIKDQADHFVGSTFSESIVTVCKSNIGKQVTLDIEERENPDPERPPYKDVVGAMPGVQATAEQARDVGPKPTTTTSPDMTIRIAALTAAAFSSADSNAVLALADKFVTWLTEAAQVQHMPFDPDAVPF